MSSAAVSVALVGLGKMGLSHLAMIRPHPDVRLVGVCDSAGYLLDVLGKYTGVATFTDYTTMLDQATPDAVLIATPSALHAPMVREALIRDIHVFCEKPLFLDPADGAELTALADSRGLVTQVGYHNKFVGAFQEVKRLLEEGAIGQVNTVQAQAYGPVVLKPAGKTWRSRRTTGGGCLYDYAAHPLDLVTWYLGKPEAVGGSRLTSIFSAEIDDAVTSTLYYPHGVTAQLTTNWSDESQRKMTTKVSLWGTGGHIHADRQEVQVYLRGTDPIPDGYRAGWTVRYTTELTEAPWFYLRGEEYSHQLDTFVRRVQQRRLDGPNTFASASVTDDVIAMIVRDAERGPNHDTEGTDGGGSGAGPASSLGRSRVATVRAGGRRLAPRVREAARVVIGRVRRARRGKQR
jgi:scyllo-inositol 2-dehydrogenase (NADP+)